MTQPGTGSRAAAPAADRSGTSLAQGRGTGAAQRTAAGEVNQATAPDMTREEGTDTAGEPAREAEAEEQDRPMLRALAERKGIVPEYVDQSGRERRVTSDATRVLLLRAMGLEAGTEAEASAALEELDRRERERLLAPTRVVRRGELGTARVQLQLPPQASGRVQWMLTLEHERGGADTMRGEADARAHSVECALPAHPEPGYHTLRAQVQWADGEAEADQRLIVAPDSCWQPADAERWRAFGLIANLYTVRGEHDWGIGNTSDLRELLQWGATIGAEFVGVNPLHALWNRGTEISPYSPVSRLYRNPLYLDVTAVPELRESPEALALLADPGFAAELRELRDGARVQYERIAELERPLLDELHRTFVEHHRGPDSARGRAYARYLEEQGEALRDFATFVALDEVLTAEQGAPSWFRHWPDGVRSCEGDAVEQFRTDYAELVDRHRWIQFELDRQLGEAAAAGRRAGMRVGLYQDLAIGTSGGGSDAWAYPHLLLQGVSIGAPPDLLGPQGQDWGLPPLDPAQLAEDGYRYWIQLLRGAFRHAGALRIDHVLGLFRQFWIPWEISAGDGAYVRFPSEELLGILALESHRHEALVVGEDLGTVPPEVPPALERWKVLSSKVLYFEQSPDGSFLPASSYAHQSLATANTHDMAPLAGYWSGRELQLRAQAGYADEEQERSSLAERARTVHRLRERLAADGLLPSAEAAVPEVELRGAVHAFLRRTPAMLVGVSLDDLSGESEPVNMPGLRPEEFPSWTRKMRRTIDELRRDPDVPIALGAALEHSGLEAAVDD